MTGVDEAQGRAGDRAYWSRIGTRERARDRLWRAHSDAVNGRLLKRWLPAQRGGRVLKTDLFDEAFGDGLVEVLRDRYATVLGIDISQSVIRAAREGHADHQWARCDVRSLPFRDAAFQAIASISTLDHFPRRADVVTALRELHRVLAPGGLLILTLDNRANPIVGMRNLLPFRLVHAMGLVPYYVGHTVGPWRARRLLVEAGFDLVDTETVMHCPRVLAVPLSRLLERRAGGASQARFLRFLLAFERLRGWPTAPWTGHFVALMAIRR
ncbi:MAG: class I SAM-dependent methyltransferase [Gemmatimonadota bacterium]